jgi:hypothetical protein
MEDSTEIEKEKKFRRAKLVTLLLMEGTIRYRQAFKDDSIKEFLMTADLNLKTAQGNVSGGNYKKILRRTEDIKKSFKIQQDQIDRSINSEITRLISNLPPSTMEAYENVVTMFYMATEELIKAKDKKQMVELMKMYNAGFFDEAFKIPNKNEKL